MIYNRLWYSAVINNNSQFIGFVYIEESTISYNPTKEIIHTLREKAKAFGGRSYGRIFNVCPGKQKGSKQWKEQN